MGTGILYRMMPFLRPSPEKHRKMLLKSLKLALREIRIMNPLADPAATKCAAVMLMLADAEYECLERVEALLDRVMEPIRSSCRGNRTSYI